MRVMVMVKSVGGEYEEGRTPSEAELAEMGRFNEELVRSGVMLAGDGLTPSARGKRVEFSGDKRTVVDGPFAEAKELVAGYWIWQVRDMDEALEWARRCPNPGGEAGVLELRPIFEEEDFGEAWTPEVREQQDRIRAGIEEQTGGR
jgi:hypothetical protein